MPAFHVPVADATATAAEMASVQAAATIVRMQAFAFMAICWVLMTAGIVKVNRYTFWLAEEHRLPRVFGFLPIAMLGLQFILLVGTKAITAIPVHWVGFSLADIKNAYCKSAAVVIGVVMWASENPTQ